MADKETLLAEYSPTSAKLTRKLISAITQSLIGVFLFGYNTSLFNVPEDQIRDHSTEYSRLNDFQWQFVNAMFPLGGMYNLLILINFNC